jgi:hypothetical protein
LSRASLRDVFQVLACLHRSPELHAAGKIPTSFTFHTSGLGASVRPTFSLLTKSGTIGSSLSHSSILFDVSHHDPCGTNAMACRCNSKNGPRIGCRGRCDRPGCSRLVGGSRLGESPSLLRPAANNPALGYSQHSSASGHLQPAPPVRPWPSDPNQQFPF